MEYDNRNSGVLFKNKRRETERQPVYTGTWTDGKGVEHWFSGWVQEDKKGDMYLTVKARPKDDQPAPQPRDYPADVDDKDLPF